MNVRWSRGQKLSLTPKGRLAEVSYQQSVTAARTIEGRASFDAALTAWAAPLALRVDDGSYLSELASGPISLKELIDAFDGCGRPQEETKEAIERLMAAGLVSSTEWQ